MVTTTQFGYATGVFLLVPLGDRLPHRPLLVTLLSLTGLGLLAASAAPGLLPLACASALVGLTTVVAPLAGPLAAGLVPKERRGVAGGTLLSGSIAGMLLSRTFGGALADWLGWRAPYVMASALSLGVAALLTRALPEPARRPSSDTASCSPNRCNSCAPSPSCAAPASTRPRCSPVSPPCGRRWHCS